MTKVVLRRVVLAAVVLLGVGFTAAAEAYTQLNGEYFFLVDMRKQDRRFIWDFESNSDDTFNNLQLRLFSQPLNGVEAFMQIAAEWNTGNNSNRRPLFQYQNAHLRFRRDFRGWGFDSYLFSRQDRFWVNNDLIRVVDGRANDGGNAQGARIDLYGWRGVNLSFIASDYSSQSNPNTGSTPEQPTPTDDGYVARYRQDFLGNRMRLGLTWNRKNNRFEGTDTTYTQVWGGDYRYNFRGTDYRVEYAEGRQVNEGTDYTRKGWDLGSFSFNDPSSWLPSDAVLKAEIRAFRVGNHDFGFLNLAGNLFYYGPDFRNEMGENINDEAGYYINTWYLVPARAITWTNNYTSLTKRATQSRHYTEWFSELYMEFKKGFTAKFQYYDRTNRDWFTDGDQTIKVVSNNDDIVAEMQVENRLAWMRVQFRIKDLDTLFQKELAAIETSINISNPLKLYTRFAFGNDPARTRKGLFAELQWRPRPGVEMFVGYGPFWIGAGGNPVFEGNLQGSADNKDLLRIILRGTF